MFGSRSRKARSVRGGVNRYSGFEQPQIIGGQPVKKPRWRFGWKRAVDGLKNILPIYKGMI